jgi:hypothetical protein
MFPFVPDFIQVRRKEGFNFLHFPFRAFYVSIGKYNLSGFIKAFK